MFTGLVEETGKVISVRKNDNNCVLTIQADKVIEGSKVGDSIAVNGVCLTVTRICGKSFMADVMPETINRSSLGNLIEGRSIVNLERAMLLGERFGGHIVSGHIDGTGVISNIKEDGNAIWYTINADEKILRYVIEKGSIAIDGISLTVAKVDNKSFSVSVIPHTRQITSLSQKKTGDVVNLENDCIGKYVEKLMGNPIQNNVKKSDITKEFLLKNGF